MRIFNGAGVPLREYQRCTAPGCLLNGRGQPTEHLDWGAAHLTVLPSRGASPVTWMGSSNVPRLWRTHEKIKIEKKLENQDSTVNLSGNSQRDSL